MKNIKAPYIPQNEIHKQADEFRSIYWGNHIPVDILEIIEFDLEIEIRPIPDLKNIIGIDALISSNFEILFVDNDQYINDNQINRLRFSAAHEIGHMILHRKFYENLGVKTFEDYTKYIDFISENQYGWIESHAYEFAGRLLVPPKQLITQIELAKKQITDANQKITDFDEETLKDVISNHVCRGFGVSSTVVFKRIIKEKISI